MPVCGVIFDLDGTLLNTLEDLADAGNATLAHFGYPAHPVESYKQFVGDGVVMLVKRALPPDAGEDFDTVLERMRLEYAQHLDKKTAPYPGIPELLDELSARGVALCVFSNKPQKFCAANMAQFFGRWQWAQIVGETPEIPRKPDPTGALSISRALNIAPRDFLFVGDTPMDMRCALGAGMTPVGVTWGFRERATMEEAGGRVFIDHPLELLGLL